MSFSWPSLTISDAISGGSNVIVLDYESEPYPFPEPNFDIQEVEHVMMTGSTGSGLRVIQQFGGSISYSDLEFEIPKLSEHNNQIFQAMIEVPGRVTLRIVFASTTPAIDRTYTCTWAKGGYKPVRWKLDPSYVSAKFKFHVQKST